ncbi:MAG TPA: hypothetical protein VER08_11735 [Pyrinomonadaceae bacterium]|nr:hypothetical protein [Pyrinomonadaceae bacterium]
MPDPVGNNWTPNDPAIAEQKRLQDENKQFTLDMFRLQQQAHRDNQEVTTKANIEKANHDAIMNMANNIK